MIAKLQTDEDLLSRIQEGDSLAFAELVKRHSTKFYALSYKYLLNREEAEDLVQSAFLKLWERPDMWRANSEAKFTTWFYRIVVNMCLDIKKKHTPLAMPENFEAVENGDSQEKLTLKNERQQVLQVNIASLPKRQRTALILCVYEELSHKEAAAIMKVGEKALQSLLSRAKATLKQKMKKYM